MSWRTGSDQGRGAGLQPPPRTWATRDILDDDDPSQYVLIKPPKNAKKAVDNHNKNTHWTGKCRSFAEEYNSAAKIKNYTCIIPGQAYEANQRRSKQGIAKLAMEGSTFLKCVRHINGEFDSCVWKECEESDQRCIIEKTENKLRNHYNNGKSKSKTQGSFRVNGEDRVEEDSIYGMSQHGGMQATLNQPEADDNPLIQLLFQMNAQLVSQETQIRYLQQQIQLLQEHVQALEEANARFEDEQSAIGNHPGC